MDAPVIAAIITGGVGFLSGTVIPLIMSARQEARQRKETAERENDRRIERELSQQKMQLAIEARLDSLHLRFDTIESRIEYTDDRIKHVERVIEIYRTKNGNGHAA